MLDSPLFRDGVYCVPECVVRVILEAHATRRVPFRVLLSEALSSERSQLQLLPFTQFHNQDI